MLATHLIIMLEMFCHTFESQQAGLYAELFLLPGVSKLRLEAEKEGESKGFPNP